jgi:hypothetical protein
MFAELADLAKKPATRALEIKNDKKRNCATVKLWLQVVDSAGSTVSQFHSFTKRNGGGLRMGGGGGKQGRGVGERQWLLGSG